MQGVHEAGEAPPSTTEKPPNEAQEVQPASVLPLSDDHVPGAQGAHDPPSTFAKRPAGHATQLDASVAPRSALDVPFGQPTHIESAALKYCPAEQVRQPVTASAAPATRPSCPGSHGLQKVALNAYEPLTHKEHDVAPAPDTVPGGH